MITAPSHAPSPGAGRGTRWTLWGVAALGAGFALVAVWQSAHHRFAVDELTYAHGAWAVAHGELPYRDFFFHHTPLLLQVLAPLFALLGDDPARIVVVRFAMLIPLALTLWACARLNASRLGVSRLDGSRGSRAEGWATAGFLLLVWPFVAHAIEIRPDNLALALFLLALAAIPAGAGRAPGRRGSAAGFALGAAVWASEKVLLYGSVFALGFLVDLVRWQRQRQAPALPRPFLLGHPAAFVAGFLVPVLTAVVYLAATDSSGAFWHWGFEWNRVHEQSYPGHSWTLYFAPFFADYWPLLPLTLLGVATSLRDLLRRPDPWSDRDLLLLPALVTTLLSFTLQTAAYRYSLVPFLALFALFTVRGLAAWLRGSTRPALRVGATALAALLLGWTAFTAGSRLLAEPTNAGQLAEWQTLERLTAPDDPVFDAAGRYVSRPHVSFFYFSDETVRLVLGDRLSREVAEGILASGCTVAWKDRQWFFLPERLKDFLYLHFEPMDEDATFWIWGRPFVRGDGHRSDGQPLTGRFLAVRDGRYFVAPEEALAAGRLTVDGRPVAGPVFELRRGLHEVVYEGEAPSFHILWLPRDGKRFHPAPGAERVFWPLHHRDPPRWDQGYDQGTVE